MSGTPGIAICPAYFLSHSTFHEVGAGFTPSGEYSSTRLSNVSAAPATPACSASLSNWPTAGTVAASKLSNSPSSVPALAIVTSIIATSICGAAFCARSVPKICAEDGSPKYVTFTPVFFTNGSITAAW